MPRPDPRLLPLLLGATSLLATACRSDAGGDEGDAGSSESTGGGSMTTPTTSPSTTVDPDSSTSMEPDASSSSEDGSSSTGADPACGDGNVDEGETCDDGNTLDGDGCNADCVPSGAVHWEVTRDGEFNGDDVFTAVALGDDGSATVTGYVAEAASGREIVVVAYDAQGEEQSAYLTGANSQNDQGSAIALIDGEAVAGGYIGGWTAQWLARVVDGAALWENAATGGAGAANAIGVVGDGLVVGGMMDGRGYLASFDGDGGSGWSWTSPMAGGCTPCDRILALEVAANGDIVVVGERAEDGDTKDALLARFSPEGDELWSVVESVPGSNQSMSRVTVTADDEIIAVREDADEVSYLLRYTGDGSSFDEIDTDPTEYIIDVATSPLGGYLVGVALPDGAAVRRHADDDSVSWEQTWASPAGGEIFPYGLAVASDGTIAIAGTFSADAEGDHDGWLVALGP